MNLNNVVLSGRLTKDVELKQSQSGKYYVQFTLAVDKLVGKEKQADFISCVAWEKLAEVLSQYTHKGSKINVMGRLSTRNYKNSDGLTIYVTEVVINQLELCDSKPKEQEQPQQEQQTPNFYTPTDDDYLPF